jgi:hypothetical protein
MVANARPYTPQAARPAAPYSSNRDSGPSYAQVLQDIRNAGMISTTTVVVVEPNAANEYLIIIRADCEMPSLREGDPHRKYTAMGAAYPRKNGANVIHGVSNPAFYMHIAESRAKKRAWMDALGRGDGLEESIRSEVFAERSRDAAQSVLAAPVAWVMSDEAASRIASMSDHTFEQAKAMSKEQAAAVVKEIQSRLALQKDPDE